MLTRLRVVIIRESKIHAHARNSEETQRVLWHFPKWPISLSRLSLVEIRDYSQSRFYPVDNDSSWPVLPPQFGRSQFKCRFKKKASLHKSRWQFKPRKYTPQLDQFNLILFCSVLTVQIVFQLKQKRELQQNDQLQGDNLTLQHIWWTRFEVDLLTFPCRMLWISLYRELLGSWRSSW